MVKKFKSSTVRVLIAASLLVGFWLGAISTAAAKTGDTIHWAGCGITKKAFMAELAQAFEKKTKIKVSLRGGGATRGIRDTADLKVDMGGSCRMSLPEIERKEMHVSLHPVAWDALAIIAHPSNPVKSLTTAQIKAIYFGQITNWKQVGGTDNPINLYARRGKLSGVGYAIRQYLFQDSSVEFKAKKFVRSSGPLEKAVEKDPYAMGITGISSARKRSVKIVAFNGKSPDFETIKSGRYGLYRPLYLVTGPKPSKNVREFVKFAKSAEGRNIIRNNGTVPYRDALSLMSKMVLYGFGVK